jgi:Flp pilus assembly protein TadG
MFAHTPLSENAPAGLTSGGRERRTPSRLGRLARRLARSERGAVLVEFGLVAPIMAMMTCAIIDFSLAMFTLNNLTIAVREGGRYAAVLKDITTNDTRVVNRVRSSIVLNGAATTYTVTVDPVRDAAGVLTNITVRINSYPYNPVTPMASLFGMRTVQMHRRAVFRSEFTND